MTVIPDFRKIWVLVMLRRGERVFVDKVWEVIIGEPARKGKSKDARSKDAREHKQGSQKPEARNKKQETRNKKQESRNKKQQKHENVIRYRRRDHREAWR
jgi:hypothetical protein